MFTSIKPYRIVVSGRIKHLFRIWRTRIAKEVEEAMRFAIDAHPEVRLSEFTVALK